MTPESAFYRSVEENLLFSFGYKPQSWNVRENTQVIQ